MSPSPTVWLGNRRRVGPLWSHHRADDGVLGFVVALDHRGDLAGGDDRQLGIADDVGEPGVVVGMGVGDDDTGEWNVGIVDGLTDQRGVGDRQHAVDHDEAVGSVDDERVDRP